jgi:hypothetical protein
MSRDTRELCPELRHPRRLPGQRPLPIMEGAFANTFANSATCCCAVRRPRSGAQRVGLWGVHGLGEDVGRCGLSAADHVGVDAEGNRGVGVAQAGRHDMDRYPG